MGELAPVAEVRRICDQPTMVGKVGAEARVATMTACSHHYRVQVHQRMFLPNGSQYNDPRPHRREILLSLGHCTVLLTSTTFSGKSTRKQAAAALFLRGRPSDQVKPRNCSAMETVKKNPNRYHPRGQRHLLSNSRGEKCCAAFLCCCLCCSALVYCTVLLK